MMAYRAMLVSETTTEPMTGTLRWMSETTSNCSSGESMSSVDESIGMMKARMVMVGHRRRTNCKESAFNRGRVSLDYP